MKRSPLFVSLVLGAALVHTPLALSESTTEGALPAGGDATSEMSDRVGCTDRSDEHEILEATVGEWTYAMTIWPFTGVEPEQTAGEAENEWVLGGRFVRQVVHGEVGGEQFEGIGYLGYDRVATAYTGIWMDTRGTTTLTGSGSYDAAEKTITLTGEFVRAGLELPFRMMLKLDSKDAYTMEMWVPGAYEVLFKSYEVAYTRKR